MSNATMNAVNYHQYVNCQIGTDSGMNSTLFNMSCLNRINEYPSIYENILLNVTHQFNTTIWIGESALHSSGGVNGETNVFASSFYYTYQLCELVKYKYMNLVLRQTLTGGYYGLINNTNNEIFLPNPDYYVLYLWRQFIGDQLFQSSFSTNNKNPSFVTGYAFNGKIDGEIVIILINFSFDTRINVKLDFQNDTFNNYQEYHFNGPLNSSITYLNGQALQYENGKLPVLNPQTGNGNVVLNPTTIVWIRCS